MARISLLFALAFVVAIGSVTAHAPINRRTQKNVCPSTLSEVQQFPSVEISKLIEKKALTGPNTLQFRTLFAVCKSYNDYLASIKFSAAKNVLGLVHAKYALVTKAMLAAQALVGVEGQLSVELSKSYTGMAKGYVSIVQTIAQLSAKYKFIASAEIRKSDRAKVEKCLSKLKAAIDVFVNVVSECSNKLTSEEKVGLPIKFRGGFIGKKSLGFRENFIGLGANGQVGGEVEAGVKLGGHAKVGAKVGAKAGAKVGAKAGAKVGAKAGAKVGSFARGLFLVHSECLESNYIASRPFRVNAGPVHAYVAVPGGKTCYLSELRSGREVIVVDQEGKQRTAVVGRVKIEKRPLILVEAKLSAEEEEETCFSIILQNAETVALVTPNQVNSLRESAIPVTSMKLGDQVLIRLQGGARHTGIEIQEFIVEN
ncbi:unnamed protein product [Microthlaspi erraticum]|uniref:3-dehydroquinate synthase C-terminal domain-containing protein n=1 Tax=Microthlaspi erraticum TaxID=1685480 RepID=A0A6D2KS38_9BRAS|nr:unnamed protein product [Microthlaspi erraticum]